MKTSINLNRLSEVLYLVSMDGPRKYFEAVFAYLEITSSVLRLEDTGSWFTACFRFTDEYI